MNLNQKDNFALLLEALAATFQKKTDEAMLEGYWIALSDLPIDIVHLAVRKAMRESEFFPTGKKLRDYAAEFRGEKTIQERAMIAWAAVDRATSEVGGYRSPDFDDPTTNAVIRNMGGWERFCVATEEEFSKWLRKDFLKAYEVLHAAGVGEEQGAPLVGICERANRINGYDVKPPVRVITGLPAPEQQPRIDGPSRQAMPRVTFQKVEDDG